MYLRVFTLLFLATVSGFPRHYKRHRRSDEIKYAPCKNIYPQCPDWKSQGWCENPQYKEYMGTVCPVTCEFCRETTKEGTLDELLPLQSKNDYIQTPPQATQYNQANVNTQASPPAAAPVASQSFADTSSPTPVTDYQAQVQRYYESIQQQQTAYRATLLNYSPTGTQNTASSYGTNPSQSSYNAAPTSPNQQYQAAQASPLPQMQQGQQVTQAASNTPSQQEAAQAQPNLAAENKTTFLTVLNQIKQNNTSSKDSPEQTSSALYAAKNKDSKSIAPLKDTREKEGEPEDDATNEKAETESKHLEKSIMKAEHEKNTKKKIKNEKIKKIKKAASATASHNKNSSLEFEKPFATTDDSDKEEDIQAHEINNDEDNENSARNSVVKEPTKEKPVHKPSTERNNTGMKPKKLHTGFHVEKSLSNVNSNPVKNKAFMKNTERSERPNIKANHAENENSLRHDDFDGIDSDSDSESGSGNEGAMEEAISKDLEELSFLTGLNFDEDDYDVADDISNELLTIESQKYTKGKRKAGELARSLIAQSPKNDNLMMINSNPDNRRDIISQKTNIKTDVNNEKNMSTKKSLTPSITDMSTKSLNQNIVRPSLAKGEAQIVINIKNNIPHPNIPSIKKDTVENAVKKSIPIASTLHVDQPKNIKPQTKSTLQLHKINNLKTRGSIIKPRANIIKKEFVSSSTGTASHVRSEITKPEETTRLAVAEISENESDAGSGESESGSGNSNTENNYSGVGSGKTEDEKTEKSINQVPQKTLLENMQKKGELKAYAVVKEVKKSVTEEQPLTPLAIKAAPAQEDAGSGSGADQDSGSHSTETDNASEMENSGDIEETTTTTEEDSNIARRHENIKQAKDATKLASDFLPAELLPGVKPAKATKSNNTSENKTKMKTKKVTEKKPVLPPVEASSEKESKSEGKKENNSKGKKENKSKGKKEKAKSSSASTSVKFEDDVLPGSQEERKEKEDKEFGSGKQLEGKLSLVLKQNFDNQYLNSKSVNYQMLAGNIKKDLETALKRVKVKDISFSEATIEGNPRQTGKTRVTFNLDGSNQEVMQALLKLVDEGNVNGLAIVKSSLEVDDD